MHIGLAPTRFAGYKELTNDDLKPFKPGDTAVLMAQKLVKGQSVDSDQVVTIVNIEPHAGKEINGVTVDRAHEKELSSWDSVDLVTYKTTDGTEHQMLYGSYVQDDGGHRGSKRIYHIHEQDEDGKARYEDYSCRFTQKFVSVEDYVKHAVEQKNDKRTAIGKLTLQLKTIGAALKGGMDELIESVLNPGQ